MHNNSMIKNEATWTNDIKNVSIFCNLWIIIVCVTIEGEADLVGCFLRQIDVSWYVSTCARIFLMANLRRKIEQWRIQIRIKIERRRIQICSPWFKFLEALMEQWSEDKTRIKHVDVSLDIWRIKAWMHVEKKHKNIVDTLKQMED